MKCVEENCKGRKLCELLSQTLQSKTYHLAKLCLYLTDQILNFEGTNGPKKGKTQFMQSPRKSGLLLPPPHYIGKIYQKPAI